MNISEEKYHLNNDQYGQNVEEYQPDCFPQGSFPCLCRLRRYNVKYDHRKKPNEENNAGVDD
jgi:hypothetical protein